MKRTVEFILGMIGAVIGLLWSSYWLVSGFIWASEYLTLDERFGASLVILCALFVDLLCIASIVFSIPYVMNRFNKLSGGILIATGVVGMIPGLIIFWLIPGGLMIAAGIMALRDLPEKGDETPANTAS